MKVKDIMSNSPLNINYNVTDTNGRRPFVPNKDEVTEAHALSAMYNLFWWTKRVEPYDAKIDAILPLIDKGSLFPFPSHGATKPSQVPQQLIDFVQRDLYYTIESAAYSTLEVQLFYAQTDIRKKYRETFEKVSGIQHDAFKIMYNTFKNPAIEPVLEQTMLALHDHLVKLQVEIPLFIASKKDPRLLVVTQEELDYHSLYYSTLREESAMRICKAFADTSGYEETYKEYMSMNTQHTLEVREGYLKDLNNLISKYTIISKQALQAQLKPIQEGFLTEADYYEMYEFIWDQIPEIWNTFLPPRFDTEVLNIPLTPTGGWEQKIEAYLKTIAKQIELYYCYYYAFNFSMMYRQSRPTHWFEFREKFNNNWRKPLKMIRSLVDLFEYKRPVFSASTGINDAFFEYLWDPKLCQLKETWMYDEIVKKIRGENHSIIHQFCDMQTMFTPYNFIEEFAMPEAIKAQAELGKAKVPSKGAYWNLDTGECTQTTIHPNELAKPGHSFRIDGAVFQSASTQPLISRKSRTTQQAPKLEDMTPEQREKAEIEAEEKQ
jgi:hypothetical protein